MKKRDLSKNDKKQICQTLLEDLIKVSWDRVFSSNFYSTEARGFGISGLESPEFICHDCR